MDASKGWGLFMLLSAAAHVAVAGAMVLAPTHTHENTPDDPIQVTLFSYEAPKKVATPPKKLKGIAVPRMKPSEASMAPAPPEPSEFEKKIQAKIKKQEMDLLKLSAKTDIPAQQKAPKTSAEILTDPVKGKIFVGYFGSVKRAIQDMLVQKYSKKAIGHGSVYLFFVLNDKGDLERVSVVDRESTADEYLRELAVQCLKEAAPFGTFPQMLSTERISFNVTIYFEQQ